MAAFHRLVRIDVFINRFQLQNLCENACSRITTSRMVKEGTKECLILSFALPFMIDGLNQIHVRIPITDIQRLLVESTDRKCYPLVCDHLKRVLTLDPDILQLTQFVTESLTVTHDGRVKFKDVSCVCDLIHVISSLFIVE